MKVLRVPVNDLDQAQKVRYSQFSVCVNDSIASNAEVLRAGCDVEGPCIMHMYDRC